MEDTREVCKRQWTQSCDIDEDDVDFTVMTYNILSDEYIKPGEYVYCPEDVRYQKTRTSHIVSEVELYNPDVVCLQEVADDHFVSILSRSMEKIGFAGCYMPYTYRKNDGLSIFYKQGKLSLVDIRKCQTGELIKGMATEMHIDKYSIAVDKLEKLCCGMLVGRFSHVRSGREVTIGNLQVTWTDFKLPSLQTLEVAVSYRALKEAAEERPFIMCGDFNSPPTFAPYHFLSRGNLLPDDPLWYSFPEFRLFAIRNQDENSDLRKYDTAEVSPAEKMAAESAIYTQKNIVFFDLSHHIMNSSHCSFSTVDRPVKSAYHTILGTEPEVTNCDAEAWKGFVHEICVDYFWYTSDIIPCGVLNTPSRYSIRRHLALPSVLHPSDHIPLMAGFKLV